MKDEFENKIKTLNDKHDANVELLLNDFKSKL